MSAAQVTEKHIDLVRYVLDAEWWGSNVEKKFAQAIADSEARATERANAQVESLISSAKNAIPASEHPAEPTFENWAWQIRNLGDDRRLVYAERDRLRAELARLDAEKPWLKEANARAERAEAELADIRALANRRNKRDHSQDTTHQLVAALDQALDIAQAELATERARLDWLESDAGMEFQWETTTVITRAAVDAAMKEEAK